jgi:ketosteroid isomerase-like protein
MKRYGLLIGIMAAALFAAVCPAQTPDRESDHEALRQLMKKATAAINAKDVDAVAGCLAKEFAFTTIDQSVITNRAGIQAYFDRMLKGPDALLAAMTCTPEADVLTRFAGDNAGYCYGRSVDRYTLKDQRVFTLDVRWSAMVVKEDGQWKASLIHTGVDLLDNPVLTARSALHRRTMAVLLGVAAVLAVAGYLVGARRSCLNRAK